jgi:hypothetical protein
MLSCGTACASSRCQSDPEWSTITPFIHSSTLSCDQHNPFPVAPRSGREPFPCPLYETDDGWTDGSQDDDEPGLSVALVMPFVSFAMSP